jgi:UDP:flavonoid glycosyltransferase YjiC (YdhE family)
MKVLLTAIGSAGDVNPFVAIGRALRQRGHRAVLLVNPYFRQKVLTAGLDFLPVGSEEDLRRLEQVSSLRHAGKRSGWEQLVLPNVPLLIEALDAAVQSDRPDLVVYHPLTFGARWVCERHGVRCALASLSPLVWMSREDGSVHARAGVRDTPPKWLLRVQLGLARHLMRWQVDRALNPIRARFGFAPSRDLFFDHVRKCDLNLGMWSPVLRGPMPDDPPNGKICGFAWFDAEAGREPVDDELERFLDEGEPPIVFTMGTTTIAGGGDFYELAAAACRQLGRRGLLLTGRDESQPRRLPPGVLAVRFAPHSRVLPRGCATVHHGGAGTTAQALRAGKPTIVVPIAHDEFDYAARLKRLGTSQTLMRKRVSAATLASFLRRILENPTANRRAPQIGQKLQHEDGAARTVELLEDLTGRH